MQICIFDVLLFYYSGTVWCSSQCFVCGLRTHNEKISGFSIETISTILWINSLIDACLLIEVKARLRKNAWFHQAIDFFFVLSFIRCFSHLYSFTLCSIMMWAFWREIFIVQGILCMKWIIFSFRCCLCSTQQNDSFPCIESCMTKVRERRRKKNSLSLFSVSFPSYRTLLIYSTFDICLIQLLIFSFLTTRHTVVLYDTYAFMSTHLHPPNVIITWRVFYVNVCVCVHDRHLFKINHQMINCIWVPVTSSSIRRLIVNQISKNI